MVKRIRLDDSSKAMVKLKTTSVDFFNTKERATIHGKGRGRSVENTIAAFDKGTITSIIEDYEVLLKVVKKQGIKFERALHYSQTDEWKKTMGKSVKDTDVPAFLRPPKKGRVKL